MKFRRGRAAVTGGETLEEPLSHKGWEGLRVPETLSGSQKTFPGRPIYFFRDWKKDEVFWYPGH